MTPRGPGVAFQRRRGPNAFVQGRPMGFGKLITSADPVGRAATMGRKGMPVQPHIDFRTARTRTTAKTVATLSLVAAGAVLLGWFLPYVSFGGFNFSLSDGSDNGELAVLGPSLIALVASIVGLSGQRWGTALAVGAATGVSMLCLVIVVSVYDSVSNSDGDNLFETSTDYGLGFYLHATAAALAIVAVFMVFSFLSEVARDEPKTVSPALGAIGAVGITASGLGLLLPDNGFSIFDIPSELIKGAYLAFIATFTLVGIVGFSFRHATGAAVGVGAATTPLLMWLADAIEGQDGGGGAFGGLSDGNTALVALGAITAAAVGIVGIRTGVSGPPRSAPAPEPASTHVADWVPPSSWMPEPDSFGGGSATSAPAVPVAPGSWHPDPTGRHDHRYWDGTAWTAHVADRGISATDPLER
jgi:hypothetical protein